MKSVSVIAAFLILFTILHLAAVNFYFYWTVWWYDIFMHVLGGFIGALIFVSFLPEAHQTKPIVFFVSVFAAIFIGIVWELYELTIGVTFTDEGKYLYDTFTDILDDIVGGLIAYLVLYPKTKQIETYEQA